MKFSESDIHVILMLHRYLPLLGADELMHLCQEFTQSDYNQPQLELNVCLGMFVGYLLLDGRVSLPLSDFC